MKTAGSIMAEMLRKQGEGASQDELNTLDKEFTNSTKKFFNDNGVNVRVSSTPIKSKNQSSTKGTT